MEIVAALPRELTDAVTIVSGCSLLFGAFTWAGSRIWMLISRESVDIERWVLDGVGAGAILGIVLALGYLGL